MHTVKEKMADVLNSQPDDASYEEIMRELAFELMVDHGLQDVREGRLIENSEMRKRIQKWQG